MVDGWTYLEAMYHLCDIISHKLNPDAAAAATYPEILETCKRVESIRGKVRKQLQGREFAKTAIDRLQHYAIRLHTSFVMSVCCRPALRHGRDKDGSNDSRRFDAAQRAELVELCKRNLTETVRMFLAMHQLSVIPTRSWAFTYHGLSSAVLLGLLPETKDDPEVRQLQGDLISALSASAQKEAAPSANDVTVHGSQQPQEKQRQQQQEQDDEHIVKTDRDIELSGPLHRALTALRNIMENGTVKGSSAVTAVPSGAIKSEPSNAPNLGSSSDGGGGGGNSMRVSSTAGGGGGSGPAPASSAGSSVPQAPVGLKTLSHAAAAMGSGYQPAGRLEKQGDEGGWSVPSGMGYGTSETPVSGEIGMQGYDKCVASPGSPQDKIICRGPFG